MAKQQKQFRKRYGTTSPGPIVISTTQDEKDVETEVLFSIDGEDYTIPTEVPAVIGLRFLDVAAEEGDAAGIRWLMREVLGDKGWMALLACDAVKGEQLAQIMQVVRDKAVGTLEAAQGN